MPFVDYQPALAPTCLQNDRGLAWLTAMGQAKDGLVADAKSAIACRMPGLCPVDALGPLGSERGIPRTPIDTDDTHRARLVAAWQLWQWAGTAYGMLQMLWYSGYPGAIIATQSGWQYTLASGFTPETGSPDSVVRAPLSAPVHLGGTPTELWSDFTVTLVSPLPAWWAGVIPADGSQDAITVASLIARWKPAHCRCVGIHVVDGPRWNGTHAWDDGTTWDEGSETNWTPAPG